MVRLSGRHVDSWPLTRWPSDPCHEAYVRGVVGGAGGRGGGGLPRASTRRPPRRADWPAQPRDRPLLWHLTGKQSPLSAPSHDTMKLLSDRRPANFDWWTKLHFVSGSHSFVHTSHTYKCANICGPLFDKFLTLHRTTKIDSLCWTVVLVVRATVSINYGAAMYE